MRLMRVLAVMALVVAALSHSSDAQAPKPLAEQLRLAGAMPRGALVYVQARDLSALMKAWTASTVRDKFYASPSFAAFSKSHVYLKFQDRRADFEKALGFGFDEGRFAELAGGASAVAVYDIGNLEIAFVTELPRERAIATALFKQLPQFQERNSPSGPYYAHDVRTDGGRLNQQFCFAYAAGKLFATTTEGLMIRALAAANSSGGNSLLGDVMAIADQAKGFATHDITIWLDQRRLNRDRLFNSYWIHRNGATELAAMESGLLDLRMTPQGLTEQRYFRIGSSDGARSSAAEPPNSLKGAQAAALLKFAPADAQFVEIRPQIKTEELAISITNSLFGRLPSVEPVRPDAPDHSNSSADDSDSRVERYSRLDARFDADVDDEQAPARGKPPARVRSAAPAAEPGLPAFAAAIGRLSPVAVCEMSRSSAETDKPFVHFERAVVIEMKTDSGLDRVSLERGIADEMRKRFVVAGVDPRLVWQDDAGVRVLGQSLLEKGAAYFVNGKYLVLASNKRFASDIAQAATSPTEAPKIDGTLGFYALVRLSAARPVFVRLMAKLDGKPAGPEKVREPKSDQDESDDEKQADIKFFSDNISSLVSASMIGEMRVRRETSGQLMVERVSYSF